MDETQNPSAANSKDVEENKLMAAVGYLGILCLIPLLLKRNSPYAQFHAKQGLVILIVWVILWIGNIIPILGQIVWAVGSVVLLIVVILGIVNALNGKMWPIPFLGKYAAQLKV